MRSPASAVVGNGEATVSNERDEHEGAPPPAEGAPGAGEVDLEALAAEDEPAPAARAGAPASKAEAEEAALDLRDLEADGIDGVVARLHRSDAAAEAEDAAAVAKPRRHRSPFVSFLVLGFGAYLLVSMFADFRYWLRSSTPETLGHASTLLQDGRTLDAYADHYVDLEGTPDVQHATRLTTKEQFIGYLRVTEGGGGLFAAVPRPKDQEVTNNFEGRYVGRLRRLPDDPAFQWLAEFYANERITTTVDLDRDGALAALGADSLPTSDGGTVTIGPRDALRLVFEGPDARVQLGRSSFADAATAERAVAALGYPYVALEPSSSFFRFVARIPVAERPRAHQALNAGLTGVEGNSDPKVGAFVLDLPASFGATLGSVTIERDGQGDAVVFPYGNNTTSLGYDEQGGRLVERKASEQVRLPLAELASLRLERVITVDPNGFVVAVGEDPASQLQAGILWLLVLAITGANAASLVLWWRRRAA